MGSQALGPRTYVGCGGECVVTVRALKDAALGFLMTVLTLLCVYYYDKPTIPLLSILVSVPVLFWLLYDTKAAQRNRRKRARRKTLRRQAEGLAATGVEAECQHLQ